MADADRGYFEWRSYANRLLWAISQWGRLLIWGEAVQPESQKCDTVSGGCHCADAYAYLIPVSHTKLSSHTNTLADAFPDAYFDPVPKAENPDSEVYGLSDQSARTDERADRVAELNAFRAGYLSATYGGRLWDSWQVYMEGKNED